MARWALPVAAGGLWAGILLAGPAPLAPAIALVAGLAGLAAAARWGRGRRRTSRRIVDAAGLAVVADPPGPRELVLAAAGFPVGVREPPDPARPGRPWARGAAAAAACVVVGAGWAGVRGALREGPGPLEGRHVTFRGTAVSDLRRFDWGWGVEVGLEEAAVSERWTEVDLRVWASGSGAGPSVEAGQPVSGTGTLRAVDPAASGFDAYLAGRGVVARANVTGLMPRGPPANPALRLAAAARRALRRGAHGALPEREAALLLGLSVGDTSGMDAEVEEDFRASGLAHLVAVSGSNVAMFLAPVLAVATRFRLRLRSRVMLGVAAIGFFALLTRWEPSVLRASAMAAAALAGVWAGRPRSTGALLGASIVALLAADPGLARSVGFQLSVAATAGLALLAGPLASRVGFLPRPVALAAAATAAAQVGVTPLLLLHFGIVPTVTLLANLLAFPAVGLALLGGLVAAGSALAWAPLGHALGGLAALPLSYLIGLADRMARAPFPSLVGSGVAMPVAAGVVAVLLAWRLRRGGRRRVGTVIAVAAVAAVT
ncbi:MAG: ComEC/Rec2 family competence protein, partial [Actinomycetota bacterium]